MIIRILNTNLYIAIFKKYDAYVIFDDFEAIEYLNTKGDVIGYEKIN